MKREKWTTVFWRDLTKKEFIPLKVLFFFIFGGMTTLFPFLTIQARSLGINEQELGIIYSLLPVVGIFAPAFAGMFADKIGNFKIFLAIMVTSSGLASLLFLLIPPGRIIHKMPDDLPISINCAVDGYKVKVIEPFTCDFLNASDILINIQQCSYKCSENIENEEAVDEFMDSWCERTANCKVRNPVYRDVDGSAFGLGATLLTDSNKTFELIDSPLEIQVSSFETKKMQINPLFCPDFKKFSETNRAFLGDLLRRQGDEHPQAKKECWLECKSKVKSQQLCQNKQSTEVKSPSLTMISYTIIRLFNGFTLSTSIPLFEGAVVAILKEHSGDLGYQRVYGNLGMIVLTPISGKLIDVFSAINDKEDYRPAFFLYCGIKIICAIIILFINLEFKKPSNSVIRDFKALIAMPEVICFILFTLVSGSCYGFVETFLFWLLDDLKADKRLMGITVTVGAVFGIPLLILSTPIIKKLGHINTLTLCLLIFVIRLLGYSLITNPWAAMPFEALESFTNSLMGVTSVSYSGALSSSSTIASLQGIYAGTHHGVGRGVGSLVGGILIKHVGTSSTFQLLALACALTSATYFLVNWFIFRKKAKKVEDNVNGNQSQEIEIDKSCQEVKVIDTVDDQQKNINQNGINKQENSNGNTVEKYIKRNDDENINDKRDNKLPKEEKLNNVDKTNLTNGTHSNQAFEQNS